MIEGTNLKLAAPKVTWAKYNLARSNEVRALIKDICDYFKQTGRIYDADLIMSNNEYVDMPGEYGSYRKRIDYEFRLRYLTEVRIYEDYINFIMSNGDFISVAITRKFFYFLEWEKEYYL